jgi:hypothetical protein
VTALKVMVPVCMSQLVALGDDYPEMPGRPWS